MSAAVSEDEARAEAVKKKKRSAPVEVEAAPVPPSEAERRERKTNPVRVVDGVRIPMPATHWGLRRIDGKGELGERLTFGVFPNGQAIEEWPVADFSVEEIRKRWGEGDFKAAWHDYAPSGKVRRYGFSKPILLRAPPAPPPEACLGCGGQWYEGAKFCPICGAPKGGHAARAAVPVGPESVGGMMHGFQLAQSFMASATAQAQIDADHRMRRFEAETNASLERERMRDKRMREEWLESMQRTSTVPAQQAPAASDIAAAVRAGVSEAVAELRDELDDLRDEMGAKDEAAAESVQSAAATIKVVGNVFTQVAPHVLPLIQGLIAKGGAAPTGGGT